LGTPIPRRSVPSSPPGSRPKDRPGPPLPAAVPVKGAVTVMRPVATRRALRACSDTRHLLDRMGNPQEGDANLGLDARRFLRFNPHDDEVRAALGRLPREYLYP
jgi:hypothetical protein